MTGKRREVAPSRGRSDGGADDSSRRKQLLEEPPLARCRRGDECADSIHRLADMTRAPAEPAVPRPTQARLQVTASDASCSATSHSEKHRRGGGRRGGSKFKSITGDCEGVFCLRAMCQCVAMETQGLNSGLRELQRRGDS